MIVADCLIVETFVVWRRICWLVWVPFGCLWCSCLRVGLWAGWLDFYGFACLAYVATGFRGDGGFAFFVVVCWRGCVADCEFGVVI